MAEVLAEQLRLAEAERIRLEEEAAATAAAEVERIRLEEERAANAAAEAERVRVERENALRSTIDPSCINPDNDWMLSTL